MSIKRHAMRRLRHCHARSLKASKTSNQNRIVNWYKATDMKSEGPPWIEGRFNRTHQNRVGMEWGVSVVIYPRKEKKEKNIQE